MAPVNMEFAAVERGVAHFCEDVCWFADSGNRAFFKMDGEGSMEDYCFHCFGHNACLLDYGGLLGGV